MTARPSEIPRAQQHEHVSILNVQYPLVQPGGKLERMVKISLGLILGAIWPAQRIRMTRGEPSGDVLGLADRLIIAALAWQHERRGTLGELSGLHQWLWRSDQAVRVHDQAEARFQSWWLDKHSAIIEPLRAAIDESAAVEHSVHTLCEIGCGGGSVLADLATRLPQIRRFVGLDLSIRQIEANRFRFADNPKLIFETANAISWLESNASACWAYFVNGGVLEYFSEQQLEALLSGIAKRHPPAIFALVEPVSPDYDFELETASRPYSAELSLGHNYLYWLRRTGWRIRFEARMDVGGSHWLLVVADVGSVTQNSKIG